MMEIFSEFLFKEICAEYGVAQLGAKHQPCMGENTPASRQLKLQVKRYSQLILDS